MDTLIYLASSTMVIVACIAVAIYIRRVVVRIQNRVISIEQLLWKMQMETDVIKSLLPRAIHSKPYSSHDW